MFAINQNLINLIFLINHYYLFDSTIFINLIIPTVTSFKI